MKMICGNFSVFSAYDFTLYLSSRMVLLKLGAAVLSESGKQFQEDCEESRSSKF